MRWRNTMIIHYTSSLYEWELIPEYWVNIILFIHLCCLSPYKLSWGLYLDWLFVVLFVKLHRMFCDISLKFLIVCNPMFFPFLLFSTQISYWFLRTLLTFFFLYWGPVYVGSVSIWLLIARHSALQERNAKDQVIRSLDD
jgi:hypothetical protein